MKKIVSLRIKEIISENKLTKPKILVLNLTHWDNFFIKEHINDLDCEITELNYDRQKESHSSFIENLDDKKFDLLFLQYPLGLRNGNKTEADVIASLIEKKIKDKGFLINISTQISFSSKHLALGADIYKRFRENILGEAFRPETSVTLSLYEFKKGPFTNNDNDKGIIQCCDLRNLKEDINNLSKVEIIKTKDSTFTSALVAISQENQIKDFKKKGLVPTSILESEKGMISVDLLKSNKKNREKVLNKIKDFDNCVFIPMIPSKTNKCEIKIDNLKDSRYWLISFDKEMFLNDYVMNFLNSEFGKEQLLGLATGNFIPHLTSSSIGRVILPMKNTEQQKKVIQNRKKLEEAQKGFNEYLKKQLDTIEDDDFEYKPEELMQQIPGYSVDRLLKEEESKSFERKSTLRFDLKQNKIQDFITDQVLKTIVAFLNTDGGTLVVGQSDDKSLVGIESDKFKNQDDCSKYFKDKIKAKIGLKFLETYIKYKFLKHEDKTLLVITCAKLPKSERAFINETDFYIRSGPSNEKLNTKATIEYIEMKSKI